MLNQPDWSRMCRESWSTFQFVSGKVSIPKRVVSIHATNNVFVFPAGASRPSCDTFRYFGERKDVIEKRTPQLELCRILFTTRFEGVQITRSWSLVRVVWTPRRVEYVWSCARFASLEVDTLARYERNEFKTKYITNILPVLKISAWEAGDWK